MTTFVFTDVNKTINVKVDTDLPKGCGGSFNILNIRGNDTNAVKAGVNLTKLQGVSSIGELAAIATSLDLKLERFGSGNDTTNTVVVPFSGIYYMGGLGIDNL
jgi:hypothetical protein